VSTRILERAVRAALAYRDLMMMPVLPILAMSGGADQPERLTVHFRDCRLVVALPPRRPAKVVLCVARTEAEAGEWDKKEMVH
jgi:hypothetical protein